MGRVPETLQTRTRVQHLPLWNPGEERGHRTQRAFEEIKPETFPNPVKDINLQVQEDE